MTTVKEILSANRDSVISSIKWIFKVWKQEDVRQKMIEFLSFCEENANVEALAASTRIKTDLKCLVGKMQQQQQDAILMKTFGTTRPKKAELLSALEFNRQ